MYLKFFPFSKMWCHIPGFDLRHDMWAVVALFNDVVKLLLRHNCNHCTTFGWWLNQKVQWKSGEREQSPSMKNLFWSNKQENLASWVKKLFPCYIIYIVLFGLIILLLVRIVGPTFWNSLYINIKNLSINNLREE